MLTYCSENLYGLGCVAFLEDKHEEAEEHFRNSLRIKETALGDSHPDVARIINRLGTLYIEQARYGEAESAFTRALSIYEKRYGPTHSRVGQVLKRTSANCDYYYCEASFTDCAFA